jgi:hypothetical protein
MAQRRCSLLSMSSKGKVIGRCMRRHRHQEFIRFLNAIEAQVPVKKIVHMILDNYAAHKHPKVPSSGLPEKSASRETITTLHLLAQRRFAVR